jgi:adenylosuccinate lyase
LALPDFANSSPDLAMRSRTWSPSPAPATAGATVSAAATTARTAVERANRWRDMNRKLEGKMGEA